MTLKEVAEFLRLSKDTVYRMAKMGKIPASKVGNQWRFRKDDVDAWLEKNKNVVSDLPAPRRARQAGKDSNGEEGR